MQVEKAYEILYTVVLCYFALLITACLIRTIIGPRITDRVLSINMIGTMVICCIAILSVRLKEGYLVDVALIYAMISFISVLILISVYLPAKKVRGRAEPLRKLLLKGGNAAKDDAREKTEAKDDEQ